MTIIMLTNLVTIYQGCFHFMNLALEVSDWIWLVGQVRNNHECSHSGMRRDTCRYSNVDRLNFRGCTSSLVSRKHLDTWNNQSNCPWSVKNPSKCIPKWSNEHYSFKLDTTWCAEEVTYSKNDLQLLSKLHGIHILAIVSFIHVGKKGIGCKGG